MFKTAITQMLGIKYPIIGGAMASMSTGEFAAAISNAGCLGLIAAASMPDKDALREQIRICRSLTDNPFGVNTTIAAKSPEKIVEDIDVVIDEGVKIIETAARSPETCVEKIKNAGLIWLHKCASVKHAVKAEKMGADIVSIVGYEGAAHTGPDDLPLSITIPLAKDTIKIPVVAAGGVADGRSFAALLALGADGVQIGTRFMLTQECPAHPQFKQWLLDSESTDTCYVQRSFGNAFRVRKNKASEAVLEMEKRGAQKEDLLYIIWGENYRKAIVEGQVDAGLVACGPVVGLLHDIPTVQEAVESIINQASDIFQKFG